MIVIVNRFLLREGFNGITLWPFIILRSNSLKNDPILLNHERIHLRQQLELLIVFFYVWYAVEFLLKWYKYGNRLIAYKNISFEREAYTNEANLSYLKNRGLWRFWKY